jgi:hypothetical protein
VTGTHQWYDGTPHPWEFARVWHLEPTAADPDNVYAGVEDAALFHHRRRPELHELSGLRKHGSGPNWQPGAGGMCLHTILIDPRDARRLYIAISAAGAFAATTPARPGGRSTVASTPRAYSTRRRRSAIAHRIALHRSRPDVLFMQKHWDVMRSDDGGESWREVSGNLPTDFGFPIDVHAHEPRPSTWCRSPATHHYPPEGSCASIAAAPAATNGRR